MWNVNVSGYVLVEAVIKVLEMHFGSSEGDAISQSARPGPIANSLNVAGATKNDLVKHF